ncbi:MAG: hypothetical protein PVJ57_21965 [Phycisphaerae bacterium]|jgi:predicted RNA-binding Zn-ribbon protein involved in translation (DUF1610 family)
MSRNTILLIVVGVLLAVAGLLLLRSPGYDDAPDDQYISFCCPECKHSFRLSHREFEQRWNAGEYERVAGEKTLLFKCPKCGKMTATRAKSSAGEAP